MPNPDSADFLAEIRIAGQHPPRRGDLILRRSVSLRRTDRRPYPATTPVPADSLASLSAAAEAQHAWLHVIGADQLRFLGLASQTAQTSEGGDESYLEDLLAWTSRRHVEADGVPSQTIVAPVDRPIPLRDFAPERETLLDPGFGDDRYATYVVIATPGDGPADWLTAGEATSAVWLTATSQRLALSPMSDVIEVHRARALLAAILPKQGYPQLVLRVGLDVQPAPPPASPRRSPNEIIDTGHEE